MIRHADRNSFAWLERYPQFPGLLLCSLAALLCYANTLGNGFCDDDRHIIVSNCLVTEPGQWGGLWFEEYWHGDPGATPYRDLLYRPLAILSYRVNHAVGGLAPWGYHLVNLALHVLVTALVYRLSYRLVGSAWAALIAGLFFAVLPIHTEAVNNVVGRAELLAAALALLALEFFARSNRWPALVAGAVCAFGACCSKESGVAIVLLVPLLDWRRGPLGGEGSVLGRLSKRYVGLAVAAVAYLALRLVALGGALYQPVTITKTINVLADATAWERVCGAVQLWGMYWAKTFWPEVLCLDYSINAVSPADSLVTGHALIGLAVLVLLAGWVVVRWLRGDRLPAVLVGALFICYLPASNTVLLIKTYFAERIWYVPSVWVAVLVGRLLYGAMRRADLRGLASRRSSSGVLLGATVLVLSVAGLARCWIRNTEWRDEGSLYAAAYRDHSTAIRANLMFGRWLTRNGRHEEGVALLKQATLIDVGFTDAHRALGVAHLLAGEMEPALEHLQIADVQIPGHAPTRRALERARRAVAASSGEQLAEAQQSAAQDPDDLEKLVRLADQLAAAGELDAAVARLTQAEQRFADVAAFHHRLAVGLVMANRRDDGVAHYRRAVALEPDDTTRIVELAMLLLDRRADGDLAEARRLADRAQGLAPNSVQVRVCRAELLALDGRRAEAAELYRALARDLPEGSDFRQACELKAQALSR